MFVLIYRQEGDWFFLVTERHRSSFAASKMDCYEAETHLRVSWKGSKQSKEAASAFFPVTDRHRSSFAASKMDCYEAETHLRVSWKGSKQSKEAASAFFLVTDRHRSSFAASNMDVHFCCADRISCTDRQKGDRICLHLIRLSMQTTIKLTVFDYTTWLRFFLRMSLKGTGFDSSPLGSSLDTSGSRCAGKILHEQHFCQTIYVHFCCADRISCTDRQKGDSICFHLIRLSMQTTIKLTVFDYTTWLTSFLRMSLKETVFDSTTWFTL